MDPFAIAATSAGLLSLATQVQGMTYTNGAGIMSREPEIQQKETELTLLRTTLSYLEEAALNYDPGKTVQKRIGELDSAFEQSDATLKTLLKCLATEPLQSSRILETSWQYLKRTKMAGFRASSYIEDEDCTYGIKTSN